MQWTAVAVLLAALAAPGAASAQLVRIKVHPVATQTLSTLEFLAGKKDGKRDTIAGELRIPALAGRLPAVILMHGSLGSFENIDDWVQPLNSMGVATFALDSLAGRGVTVAEAPGGIAPAARTIDAYRALELVSGHSRIDPERIAIMGFSHGGVAALYSGLKRFARMHGPADGRQFAAHIVFYPQCNVTWLESGDVSDKPIRIFHGALDDSTPIAPCHEYAARLRASGKDVVLNEYPGAHHAFDMKRLKEPLLSPRVNPARNCRLVEAADGSFTNSVTGQAFRGPADPCMTGGA